MNHFLKTHAICFFAALSNLVSSHNSSNMLRSYKGTTDFPKFGRENPRGIEHHINLKEGTVPFKWNLQIPLYAKKRN